MSGPSGSETASQTRADAAELYVPSKSKSDIWKYFRLKKDENNKVWAVCLKCPNKLSYCSGTTTLWNHATQVHFIQKPKKSKQPVDDEATISDPVSAPSTSTSSRPSVKQVSIKEAFARDDTQSIT